MALAARGRGFFCDGGGGGAAGGAGEVLFCFHRATPIRCQLLLIRFIFGGLETGKVQRAAKLVLAEAGGRSARGFGLAGAYCAVLGLGIHFGCPWGMSPFVVALMRKGGTQRILRRPYSKAALSWKKASKGKTNKSVLKTRIYPSYADGRE
ncbi:MAG TPA: hypothetical protein VEF76_05955 [Patescibacteria group bacterium]|nr:hypothetical protein [Patescibacteria group bacterium]